MKLLFLDIDGVINNHVKTESGFTTIDQTIVPYINHILDQVPDVQVVISSAWRYLLLNQHMTLKGFEIMLQTYGLKVYNRIHGHTMIDETPTPPSTEPCTDPDYWHRIAIKERGKQIHRYVMEHKPTHFAVLDDLPINAQNLIQTEGSLGLTFNQALQAVELLTRD